MEAGRIAQRFGTPVFFKDISKITHAFPKPEILRNVPRRFALWQQQAATQSCRPTGVSDSKPS
jgi:hypothetical protein